MALTPEAMHQDEPDEKPELVDGAVANWALYPEVVGFVWPPNKQVIPSGMWPWESPLSMAAVADQKAEPVDREKFNERVVEAFEFPFGKPEPQTEAKAHVTATRTTHVEVNRPNNRGSAPPAASQH